MVWVFTAPSPTQLIDCKMWMITVRKKHYPQGLPIGRILYREKDVAEDKLDKLHKDNRAEKDVVESYASSVMGLFGKFAKKLVTKQVVKETIPEIRKEIEERVGREMSPAERERAMKLVELSAKKANTESQPSQSLCVKKCVMST